MFWKKKTTNKVNNQAKNYYFCSGEYNNKYPISEDEQKFLDALYEKTKLVKGLFFKLDRMSNGTIAVSTSEGCVGKIRLCKQKHWMMIFTSLYDHEIIEGSLDDFIQAIDLWIKYIKKYL